MKSKPMTAEWLCSILRYDPDTGLFTWIANYHKSKVGKVAGQIDSEGYSVITINGRRYFAHRLAWLYTYGQFPDQLIDHKNRIKSDNKILNLQDVTNSENQQNIALASNGSSCGLRGVCLHKQTGKWQAQIITNRQYKYLGLFKTPELAHLAYLDEKVKQHTNLPLELLRAAA